jgi:hypothetical protein
MTPNQEQHNRRQHEAAAERARRVIRLRATGETWASIGRIIGVSRQRAQALARAHQARERV